MSWIKKRRKAAGTCANGARIGVHVAVVRACGEWGAPARAMPIARARRTCSSDAAQCRPIEISSSLRGDANERAGASPSGRTRRVSRAFHDARRKAGGSVARRAHAGCVACIGGRIAAGVAPETPDAPARDGRGLSSFSPSRSSRSGIRNAAGATTRRQRRSARAGSDGAACVGRSCLHRAGGQRARRRQAPGKCVPAKRSRHAAQVDGHRMASNGVEWRMPMGIAPRGAALSTVTRAFDPDDRPTVAKARRAALDRGSRGMFFGEGQVPRAGVACADPGGTGAAGGGAADGARMDSPGARRGDIRVPGARRRRAAARARAPAHSAAIVRVRPPVAYSCATRRPLRAPRSPARAIGRSRRARRRSAPRAARRRARLAARTRCSMSAAPR